MLILLVPFSQYIRSLPRKVYTTCLEQQVEKSIYGNFILSFSDLNGIPRTRVRVPVEMHVFHISSIVSVRPFRLYVI